MTLTPSLLAKFVSEGTWAGLGALAVDRIRRAQASLETCKPEDVVAVAKAQEEIRIWKAISGLPEQIKHYAEQASAKPQSTGG